MDPASSAGGFHSIPQIPIAPKVQLEKIRQIPFEYVFSTSAQQVASTLHNQCGQLLNGAGIWSGAGTSWSLGYTIEKLLDTALEFRLKGKLQLARIICKAIIDCQLPLIRECYEKYIRSAKAFDKWFSEQAMTEDENQALMQCLKIAADGNNCPIAAFYYGKLISEANPSLARSYLLQAAESGVEEAQSLLNELNQSTSTTSNSGKIAFEKGNKLLLHNDNQLWTVGLEAAACFEEAIQQGYGPPAQAALNKLVKKDSQYFQNSIYFYHDLAYQSSNIPALLYAGNQLTGGLWRAAALVCFEKIAESGDIPGMLKAAQLNLKILEESTPSRLMDLQESATSLLLKAVEYYAMAIKSGNDEAANELKEVLIKYTYLAKEIATELSVKRSSRLPLVLCEEIVTITATAGHTKALEMLAQISVEKYLLYMVKRSLYFPGTFNQEGESENLRSKTRLLLEQTSKLATSGKSEAAQEIGVELLTIAVKLGHPL